jgi:hypothetical protein
MLHRAMRSAPHRRIVMAINMAREAGPLFSVVDSMFAHNVS